MWPRALQQFYCYLYCQVGWTKPQDAEDTNTLLTTDTINCWGDQDHSHPRVRQSQGKNPVTVNKAELKPKNSEHTSNILQGKLNKSSPTPDRQILCWKFHCVTLGKVGFNRHSSEADRGSSCLHKLMMQIKETGKWHREHLGPNCQWNDLTQGGIVGVSCTWPGAGLHDPCGSLPTLWFCEL